MTWWKMFKIRILVVQLVLICRGIHRVSSKDLYVSHHGHDDLNCGNWTSPCRSVRYAVKISNSSDVISIDYADGKPYKECENRTRKENPIMLDKSLSFYGLNGNALVLCEQSYSLFRIKNTWNTLSKIVFSDLSLVSRGILVDTLYNINSKLEVEFNSCDIKESVKLVTATSLFCLIQVLNSRIHSYEDPITLYCSNLTARLVGSTFFSCQITLQGTIDQKLVSNVLIYNCTFEPTERFCGTIVNVLVGTATCNVTIKSSIFLNFYGRRRATWYSALSFSSSFVPNNISIVLDRLRFENVRSPYGLINLQLLTNGAEKQFDVGIYNSVFINTTCVLKSSIKTIDGLVNRKSVKFYNNTFNTTTFDQLGPDVVLHLSSGSYHFSTCYFLHSVPMHLLVFPLIRVGSKTKVKFENVFYENDQFPRSSRNGNLLKSSFYDIISYESHPRPVQLVGYFIVVCASGYFAHLRFKCYGGEPPWYCNLFIASCEQCPPKTYSLERGIIHETSSNRITCHNCPVGGSCTEGQVTSKPNFWGYRSNRTVTFLQCPPKYCCETDDCRHYNSCYGNRMGTLCGKCPKGMSESLFDTKCKMNEDCTSVTFWPGISAYLILYLLFFLYQGDIISFLQRRVIPSWFLPSHNGRNLKPGGLLKIVFYFYQVANLLRNSVGIDKKVKYFADMDNFLFRAFNFLIINIPSFVCPFQDLRAVEKTIFVHSVGYSLLILLCLLCLFTSLFKILRILRARSAQQTVVYTQTIDHGRGMNENPFFGRMAGAFANISLLMYASSTQLCLSLLHCVTIRDSPVLFIDGDIQCYQPFQYFLFIYMISSILPFCLVPVFGSYLLKFGRIGFKQYCTACIFPLPFCCYWTYLLVRNSSWWTTLSCRTITTHQMEVDQVVDNVDENSPSSVGSDSRGFANGNLRSEGELSSSESAILGVLLGPFRLHEETFIFPSSHLPWEGFLIFRRLVLIVVLTFVHDNRVKAMLSLILCLVILLPHVFVWPFKTTSDNVLETLSLGTLVIIAGFCLIKSVYYGQDLDSGSLSLLKIINLVESLLTVFPVVLILCLVILFILVKLAAMCRFCFQALFRRLRMLTHRLFVE